MKAIRVHQLGGPEVLQFEEIPDPSPGPGEAVVRVEAAGVNFIDVYHRTGLYKVAPPPFTLGQEGAGTVESVGEGVTEVAPGDPVAWTNVLGSYAEKALVPVAKLVPRPEGVSARQGAAVMLQGMTAHYLACSTYPLKPGDTCLVHAAAGGVGLLLCQIAKLRGARVLGTTSNEEKAALAREAGADEVILYTEKDFAVEAKRLTGGKGVQVIYDGVGQTTFEKGLDALAPRGMMVTFGQSSGSVPPFAPSILNTKGSLYVTRPSLGHYIATREELLARAGDVLGWIRDGKLALRAEHDFPLAQAADAQSALEGRKTTGKVLLIP
jgi:NADPH2:quinone reductase